MSSPFVAEIRIVGFNFAPMGWAFCNGQLLPISQNTALFSLLGTTYGGDGRSTFALPNFQGCAAMHHGQGPGLTDRSLGETAGESSVTLLNTEMPIHSHTAMAIGGFGNRADPSGNSWARSSFAPYAAASSPAQMNVFELDAAGQGLLHNNMAPYLALNFIIALQGIFPPRN